MEVKDMGYDVGNGTHDPEYTQRETDLLAILTANCGPDGKISANTLALMWEWPGIWIRRMPNQRDLDLAKRDVRYMVNHLIIHHNQPILSKAGYDGGYWLAKNEGEAEEFYWRFRKRAMTGMTKAARGKRAALADMVTQLSFEFDEILENRPKTAKHLPQLEWPTAAEIITKTLERMTAQPERYAGALQQIRDKFRSILMPKEKAKALKETADRLSYLLQDLEIA